MTREERLRLAELQAEMATKSFVAALRFLSDEKRLEVFAYVGHTYCFGCGGEFREGNARCVCGQDE